MFNGVNNALAAVMWVGVKEQMWSVDPRTESSEQIPNHKKQLHDRQVSIVQ